MNETDYKRLITNGLIYHGWDIQWHEDSYQNYIPDISFGAHGHHGWIEVKFVERAPKTIGSIAHYTKGQEDWLVRRGEAGAGRCYLLLGTWAGHLLLPHTSLRNARTATYIAAQSLSGAVWVPGPAERVAGMVDAMNQLLIRSPDFAPLTGGGVTEIAGSK